MEHGSLQNLLIASSNSNKPKVGMGATIVLWTDRKAYTIIEVSKSGKSIVIQRDEAIRKDSFGMSDSQKYEFRSDSNGVTESVRSYKGKWKSRIGKVIVGIREEYYDYSF